MIVIVAGPDRSGKTTLVRILGEIFGVTPRKACCIADDGETIAAVATYLREETELYKPLYSGPHKPLQPPILWDRWWYPDDVIYRAVAEGRESILLPYAQVIEQQLKRLQTVVLHVTASQETLEARYKQLGEDDYLPKSKLPALLEAYERFFLDTKLPAYRICTDDSVSSKLTTVTRACRYIRQATLQFLLEEGVATK